MCYALVDGVGGGVCGDVRGVRVRVVVVGMSLVNEPQGYKLSTHNVAYVQPTTKTSDVNKGRKIPKASYIPPQTPFYRACRQRRVKHPAKRHSRVLCKQIRYANQSNMTSPHRVQPNTLIGVRAWPDQRRPRPRPVPVDRSRSRPARAGPCMLPPLPSLSSALERGRRKITSS